MKRICWITPDYFIDVDAFIVPQLSHDYEIDWILISTRDSERNIKNLQHYFLSPKRITLHYRQRDPRVIMQYLSIMREINRKSYDLIYTSFHGFPYFFPIFLACCDLSKVIYATHNFTTPRGASNEIFMRIYQDYALRFMNRIHVFSKSQLAEVASILPRKQAYYAPLALKDYGPAMSVPPAEPIRFLSFGYIRPYKRLDLLIKAFESVYLSGITNIELHIAGKCDNWDYYESMISLKGRIKTRIEIIPNEEVPDLISSCHYVVLPYQDIAQSGVLMLAYQYHKPIIASNIEPFKEFVSEGETGYFFKTESYEDLALVIRKAVLSHPEKYEKLQVNVANRALNGYSIPIVLHFYRTFLDECLMANDNPNALTAVRC